MNEPRDVPRTELMAMAEQALERAPSGSAVFFKFTCEQCGQRCTFAEPNTLRERGECFACGHETEVLAGGFMLLMKTQPTLQN